MGTAPGTNKRSSEIVWGWRVDLLRNGATRNRPGLTSSARPVPLRSIAAQPSNVPPNVVAVSALERIRTPRAAPFGETDTRSLRPTTPFVRPVSTANSGGIVRGIPEAETFTWAADLGDLEREVLRLVWRFGSVTAEKVRGELDRPLKESTVRTVLRRLEEKGHLTHVVDGRTFVFRAVEPRSRAAAKAVKRIADWFCEGSVEEVLVGLVDAKMLDRTDLTRLAETINQSKGRPRK
jgi:BlaI family penicillinase repressor